ncbi:ladderlectin-like [Sinocyclocheilus grahami]|uniref:ladderlectin-like n=1 Tax=Sinocyclocheilus grahami TaxID=75366 RepID=UPI0007AD020D|nr:PREDICTED: ladderlectin-like [Sinocyclocheilus grahami]
MQMLIWLKNALMDGCYKFFPQSVNWITAERNCQSLGSNLASVHNKMENDFLLSLVPSSTRSWVGVHYGVQEVQWVWSDGTPYDYTYWCSYEPDGGGSENCVLINWTSSSCWVNIHCSISVGYVCAKDL